MPQRLTSEEMHRHVSTDPLPDHPELVAQTVAAPATTVIDWMVERGGFGTGPRLDLRASANGQGYARITTAGAPDASCAIRPLAMEWPGGAHEALAKGLGAEVVTVVAMRADIGRRRKGAMFQITDATGTRDRIVMAMKNPKGWAFWADGTARPFEETGRYTRRRIADRLTRAMVFRYLAALGFDAEALFTGDGTVLSAARAS